MEPFERFFIFRMRFDEIGGSLGEKFPNPSLRFKTVEKLWENFAKKRVECADNPLTNCRTIATIC